VYGVTNTANKNGTKEKKNKQLSDIQTFNVVYRSVGKIEIQLFRLGLSQLVSFFNTAKSTAVVKVIVVCRVVEGLHQI
jgi:hypothetical protein